MKKLSDYKDEDAIELWANLLDPFVEIVGDPKVANMLRAKKPPLLIAKEMVKEYKKQVSEILLAIDPTPINGLNIVFRLASVVSEIMKDEDVQSFFVSVPEEKKEKTSSGLVMENTEASVNSDTSSDM